MAQKSYPWPGVAPASGADAGRYTAAEWWGTWAAMQRAGGVILSAPLLRTLAALANIGVFYSVANRLAVTNPAANQARADTGAWLCDGQIGYNDTAFTGAITSPAANPRIDRVIVRKNFTGNTYNPASAGPAFDVPPYTARITVIHGAEAPAPVAPGLIQDTARNPAGVFGVDGTWDIPLAQYQIAVAGTITGLTDERVWVDAETKTLYVPPLAGRNASDATDIYIETWTGVSNTPGPYVRMIDLKSVEVFGRFIAPVDYISSMIARAVVMISAVTNNAFCHNKASKGACGEQLGGLDDNGIAAHQITGNYFMTCVDPLAITALAVSDFVRIRFERDGTNAADTIGDTVYCLGWIVQYLGWR